MFILKKGHQPGVYVPLRALFLVFFAYAKSRFPSLISFHVISDNYLYKSYSRLEIVNCNKKLPYFI